MAWRDAIDDSPMNLSKMDPSLSRRDRKRWRLRVLVFLPILDSGEDGITYVD